MGSRTIKNKKLLLLTSLHVYLIMTALTALVTQGFQQPYGIGYLRAMFGVIPLVIFFLTFEYLEKLWVSLLGLIVCLLAAWLVSQEPLDMAIYIIVTVILFISYLAAAVRHNRSWLERPHIGFIVIFILIYLLAARLGMEAVLIMAHYHTGIYLLMLIVYQNISSTESYLALNRQVSSLPGKSIRSINNAYTGIPVFMGGILLLLIPAGGQQSILGYIKNFLMRLIRSLLLFLSRITSESDYAAETIQETVQETEEEMAWLFTEAAESPAWIQALDKIFTTVAVIAMTAGAVYLLSRFLKNIHVQFYKRKKRIQEAVIVEEQDFIEDLSKARKKEKGRKRFFLSPEETVRYQYKRLIDRLSKEPLSPDCTPTDAENHAKIKAGSDRDQLHALYLKTRYSRAEISAAEAQAMKEACKTIKNNQVK